MTENGTFIFQKEESCPDYFSAIIFGFDFFQPHLNVFKDSGDFVCAPRGVCVPIAIKEHSCAHGNGNSK